MAIGTMNCDHVQRDKLNSIKLRIPAIVIAQSGHRDRHSGQADHASERSDAKVSACRALLSSGTSSYWFLIVHAHRHEGLWSVVGGAFFAPSKDLWETRPAVFHRSGTIHRPVRRA
jgi:hypothetical protein